MNYEAGIVTQGVSYLKANLTRDNATKKELKWLESCMENAARFSTCSKAQYFSVILDSNGFLVSQGWNGTPSGTIHCKSGGCQRAVDNSPSGSSYHNCSAAHAEQGAIIRAPMEKLWNDDVTLIINGTPCMDCARLILHSGIKRVICVKNDKYDFLKVKDFLNLFDVTVVPVAMSGNCIYCNGQVEHEHTLACRGCDLIMDVIHKDTDEATMEEISYIGSNQVSNGKLFCGVCREVVAPSKHAKIDRNEDGTIRGIIHSRCRNMLSRYAHDTDTMLKVAANDRILTMRESSARQ